MAKPSPRSPLAEVQALMARAVMRPLTADESTQTAWTDGLPTSGIAESFLKPNDRLSSLERLQIYNQQYWWRLQSAFAEDFRGLRAVLGERRFDKLATAYLDQCGSMSWTLRNLGSRLENFLRERPELTTPHQTLALDMTRVEWARVVAFDEEEKPARTAARIKRIPPSLLTLGLQPYISLLELSYPIDEMLRKLKRQANIETGSASNAVSSERPRARRRLTARPGDQPIYLAVHRVDFSVYYKRLEAPAYRLLSSLRAGTVLETACEEAFEGSVESAESSAAKLHGWFADWMQFGWFV